MENASGNDEIQKTKKLKADVTMEVGTGVLPNA
jgi:hypothetical protein